MWSLVKLNPVPFVESKGQRFTLNTYFNDYTEKDTWLWLVTEELSDVSVPLWDG